MAAVKKVLYADDEPDIRTVVTLALQTIGNLEVCVCESGQEALDNIEDFQPDIVLLDVMMPNMDGPQTMSRIRKISGCENTPIIFFTAKTRQEDIQNFMKLGAIKVLQKPFDPMTLTDDIQEAWNQYQAELPKKAKEKKEFDQTLEQLSSMFLTALKNDVETLTEMNGNLGKFTIAKESHYALSQIEAIAHRLAGRGGTFGFPKVTDLGRELEKISRLESRKDGPISNEYQQSMIQIVEKLSALCA